MENIVLWNSYDSLWEKNSFDNSAGPVFKNKNSEDTEM